MSIGWFLRFCSLFLVAPEAKQFLSLFLEKVFDRFLLRFQVTTTDPSTLLRKKALMRFNYSSLLTVRLRISYVAIEAVSRVNEQRAVARR